MPTQDFDAENNQDISEDIEYISENNLIHHVEIDGEDENNTLEMELASEDELPETYEISNFDISSLTFIARFYRIISCLENILSAMRKCLITYPPESAIGSSLRSRNLNFLTSWRLIFEKIHVFFESSACVITLVTNQKISTDAICTAIQNMNEEDKNWLENGICVVTGVKDRIDYVLESVSSTKDKTAEDALKNLDDLIFKQIALIPDGAMMFNYYIKLIPTVIERMDGYFFYTNQFSVTKFEKHLSITEGDSGMPGIFFSYELSPLMVKRVEQQKSFSHLIMTVLSYISGVYIAALLIDSLVHKTVKYVQKLEIGKQS